MPIIVPEEWLVTVQPRHQKTAARREHWRLFRQELRRLWWPRLQAAAVPILLLAIAGLQVKP